MRDDAHRLNLFNGYLKNEKKMTPFSGGKPRVIKDFARFWANAPCKCQLHSRKLAFGSTAGKLA